MRFPAGLLCAASLLGQGFDQPWDKAPPHIDKALRERVSFFFDMHQSGQFRRADSVVHEDSKDAFFEAERLRFRSYKIVKINYSDEFRKASAVIDLDMEHHFPGFKTMDVNRAFVSTWKADSAGVWWWYVDRGARPEWPFNPNGPTAGGVSQQRSITELIEREGIKFDEIRSKVSVDRDSIELKSHEASSGEFIITNRFEGPVEISMQADDFDGVSYRLESSKIEPGTSTTLRVSCKPLHAAKKPDLRVILSVQPLGKVIPLTVRFAYPPFNETESGSKARVAK